jgi:hypothetical protein
MRSAKSTIGRERVPKRVDDVSDASHPIPTGETVTVLRLPRTAAPFIEGRAVIKGPMRGSHHYWVVFNGEVVARQRFVHAEYQGAAAERLLEIMVEIWRASNSPAIDEFFPFEEND